VKGGASGPVLETLRASFKVLRYLMLALVVIYLCSGIFIVRPEEKAFILRFGKIVGKTRAEREKTPGIYYALPFPIDSVVRVPVKKLRHVELADMWRPVPSARRAEDERARGKKGGVREDVSSVDQEFLPSIDPTREGYCITGDQNIVQPRIEVKYQVEDPEKFLFRSVDPTAIISSAAYAETLRAIGRSGVDAVLTVGQRNLAVMIQHEAQSRLSALDAGIVIVAVEFKELIPPRHVYKDFQMVASAYIQRQTKIGEALSYAKSEIPKALSLKAGLITEAQAYREQAIAQAKGEKAKFEALLSEYRKSPVVIKQRLYREALEKVFSVVGRRIFVSSGGEDRVRVLVGTETN